jgi:homocysteine S-methyltransferase
MPKKSLLDYYAKVNRPLILDGAMGSLLESYYSLDKVLWSSILNIYSPDKIIEIHKKYLDAGAEILTTNTFRTNPAAVEASNYNLDVSKFVKNSVNLARNLVDREGIFIAGSNAPAEDCYQKYRSLPFNKLEYNHKKHIELLFESGSDFILNETQSHFDEIKIISEFCHTNNIPFIISLYTDDGKKILSGEPLKEVVQFIIMFKPIAISINCVSTEIFNKINSEIYTNYKHGFYLNMGNKNRDGEFNDIISPINYKKYVKNYLTKNTLFIGACCGSNPNHIKEIKELINEIY